MTIAQEEIFGPVLSIISYNDLDDAVEIANDTVYGLAAYVKAVTKIQWLMLPADALKPDSPELRRWRSDAPFGGYKQSGNGREKKTGL